MKRKEIEIYDSPKKNFLLTGNAKVGTSEPPKSKLSNLDALNVDGSRQSVPVTKKLKKNDDANDSNLSGGKKRNDANHSVGEKRTLKTPVSRNYVLTERGIFKKQTPITSMKLTDPRSEKLSIASLRRRYGLPTSSSMEKAETFRTTTVTRYSQAFRVRYNG